MYEHLILLESRCGNMCKLIDFGRTYERRPLYALKITPNLGRSNSKTVVIDGGIHAREWIASASVMRIADYLVKYVTESNVIFLISYHSWVI